MQCGSPSFKFTLLPFHSLCQKRVQKLKRSKRQLTEEFSSVQDLLLLLTGYKMHLFLSLDLVTHRVIWYACNRTNANVITMIIDMIIRVTLTLCMPVEITIITIGRNKWLWQTTSLQERSVTFFIKIWELGYILLCQTSSCASIYPFSFSSHFETSKLS